MIFLVSELDHFIFVFLLNVDLDAYNRYRFNYYVVHTISVPKVFFFQSVNIHFLRHNKILLLNYTCNRLIYSFLNLNCSYITYTMIIDCYLTWMKIEKAVPSAGHFLQRNKRKEQSSNRTLKEYCIVHNIVFIVHYT